MIQPEGAEQTVVQTVSLIGAVWSGLVAFASHDWSMLIFGQPVTVLAAGFSGALIALSVMPTIHRWYVALLIGTVTAGYATPQLTAMLPWTITDLRGVAFFVGLFGLAMITLLFEDGRTMLRAWLRKRLGLEG